MEQSHLQQLWDAQDLRGCSHRRLRKVGEGHQSTIDKLSVIRQISDEGETLLLSLAIIRLLFLRLRLC